MTSPSLPKLHHSFVFNSGAMSRPVTERFTVDFHPESKLVYTILHSYQSSARKTAYKGPKSHNSVCFKTQFRCVYIVRGQLGICVHTVTGLNKIHNAENKC